MVWHLGSGLIGVTGETGAGKSVIVGALKLVLGERADKALIRTGEETCMVEAIFDLGDAQAVNAILESSGLDACDEGQLIVKRVIGQSSNKQFINNSPATLAVLKRMGAYLVDLHGPHDHQGLLSTERQLSMLDAYAGSTELCSDYHQTWQQWRVADSALKAFQSAEIEGERELDLLHHQLTEIDEAKPNPDEEEELERSFQRSSNSSRLVELAGGATQMISQGEDTLMDRFGQLQKMCRDLEKLDPELRESLEGIDRAVMELQEIDSSLVDYLEDLLSLIHI